jgi:hypothetical protein
MRKGLARGGALEARRYGNSQNLKFAEDDLTGGRPSTAKRVCGVATAHTLLLFGGYSFKL